MDSKPTITQADKTVADLMRLAADDMYKRREIAARHREAATLEGIRLGLEAAAKGLHPAWFPTDYNHAEAQRSIRALDPAQVLREHTTFIPRETGEHHD